MANKTPRTEEPLSKATQSATRAGLGGVDAPYVVLARKYRPERFDQLIGQDAMVTTLRNAFAADRIAQAYMLTGVRGVGKTTTARILARALNYSRPGEPDRPSIDLEDHGEHCLDIMQSRHPDVIEMDAASNTGVDNVREIIENARYKPLLARYKVFIVDEVHMLSKSAFNALLKTLEEPPPHVKFIFATTEVRKVPVTVLSRCQRFDLRRVDVRQLAAHLRAIADREGAAADDEALAQIARAAGGSVRDSLSILDQAIAMGAGAVGVPVVRAMLGLADRGRVFDLLEALMRGAAGEALEQFAHLHGDGADPAQLLADLAEAVHAAARARVVGAAAAGEELSAEEKRRSIALAGQLSTTVLTRAWQMLQKGFDEVSRAADQQQAAEMVLIRIAHAAELPSPEDLVRLLLGPDAPSRGEPPGDAVDRPVRSGQPQTYGVPPRAVAAGELRGAAASPARSPDTGPQSFTEVVDLAGERRDMRLKVHLEENVRLVRFEPGRLEIHLMDAAPGGLANEIGEKLGRWTGRRWVVAVSREEGEPPLGDVRRQRAAAEIAEIRRHPAVQAVLEVFPEAEIKDVRPMPDAGEDGAAG